MDHLTWLWEIQEQAADGTLPALPDTVLRAAAVADASASEAELQKRFRKSQERAVEITAIEELAEQFAFSRLTEAAAALWQRQTVQAELPSASMAAKHEAAAFGSGAAYGGLADGFGVGPTMEEISRFFEIDARRF